MATGTISKNMVLLWENPNPTNAFAAQTISLNLSGYEFVVIETHANSTSSTVKYKLFSLCAIGETIFPQFILNAGTSIDLPTIVSRELNVQSNGVVCSNGYYKTTNQTTTGEVQNNRCVPIHIWGIKA